MENRIKDILKAIKLNENTISMVLGLGVVAIIGTMVVNYFRETPANLPTVEDTSISQALDQIASDSTMSGELENSTKDNDLAQAVTISPTKKPSPTKIPTPTSTPQPTATLIPTKAPTNTPVPPTVTMAPTSTVAPSPTKVPTATAAPTIATPTSTPVGKIASGVSTSKEEQQVAGVSGGKYTVQKGDNLWKIAENQYKTGYGWVEIAKANNLKKVGLIEAGQELVIPQLSKQYPATIKDNTGANIANEPAKTQISADSYTVVRGDNLWNIAVRAYGDGFKWNVIYEANRTTINNPRYIEVGMNLKLPRS